MNLANKITMLRIGLVPIFLLFALPVPQILLTFFPSLGFINQYGLVISIIIFILAACSDKVDGYIARKRNEVTNLGIFLDPLADKLLVAAALICLVEKSELSTWIAMIIIGREFIITSFRIVAIGQGKIMAADRLGKYKLVAQVIAIVLALTAIEPIGLLSDFPLHNIFMCIAVLLTIYSGIHYMYKNRSVLEGVVR
ncbi:CDP-diacylglycerol--glycerol-3-phosphate 3-phosphatidyltransferase [Lederbergia sp. NSJ-179]|uniref:CDP-diacylglycerol--glycerol-3-phosphate 3-phosphatidyltransferase n=1 Tax=Lederbergia sp. NSJ-179 TaxID=2931402 RepID=UPI001FD08077|nr:CDP-diacylglycerol--glycerol-3-phosphate 3-phosphatidyltransferase [Lederbergia sp. NSJ-179]MCJ7841011.1 CDP-diacylglycerol--glycerol-3-phosphate 3-phosphatidyltransferase [Lederbergia sp. NSJ-179]